MTDLTDLTDRMRTCAAHIVSVEAHVGPDGRSILEVRTTRDAAALLIEAADALDRLVVPLPLGEPMEIIPPAEAAPEQDTSAVASAVWIAPGGPLPGLKQSGTTSSRACPRCDSRGYKRVYRVSCQMMIACQVCGHSWEFGREG